MGNARKAWVFRRGDSWCCGWYEPDGNMRRKSFGSKKTDANNFCKVKTAELIQGISTGYAASNWQKFVDDFREKKLARLRPNSRLAYENAISHFERICKPAKTSDLDTKAIDNYTAKRLSERGLKPGSKTSPATVNKELRAIKRLVRVAKEWKKLAEVPHIEFVREPDVGITFISASDFAKLYAACDAATKPAIQGIDSADWWRGFLLYLYMTGWRVREVLKLRREDVDLEKGVATTRAADNKGRTESTVPLHPIVVEHIRKLKSFAPAVFPWHDDDYQLWPQLRLIQAKAGIAKVCRKDHEHNDACKRFGFHDLRRGFATANAANLTASQLQTLMRHSSYTTTQRYIEMAEQVQQSDVVARLSVPELRGAQ